MTGNVFCILVEGELHSPELAPLTQMITRIFDENNINYLPKVVAVRGCSVFNTVASIYYREYSAHNTMPICAIADRDYRINANVSNGNAKQEKPSLFFLPRHEWENYLLDDLSLIADILMDIPFGKNKKAYRLKNVDSQSLQDFIQNYFSNENQIKAEFFECLKYCLSNRGVKQRPSMGKYSGEDLKTWYERKMADTKSIMQNEAPSFDEVCAEFLWNTLLENTSSCLDHKKRIFRGKEVFKALMSFSVETFGIHNYKREQFQTEILKRWAIQSHKSTLYCDLEAILLKHFENNGSNK